jgi:enoyl-CoA hydratase/carnithine racemase
MPQQKFGDVSVELTEHVAHVEIHRPPHNFFDVQLIRDLADAFEALDKESACRALVLAAEGKSFCAGANFANRQEHGGGEPVSGGPANPLYAEAVRLFACKKPVVVAIQGAAIGGGFGLALAADFRVVSADARFAANFVKLGIHPGFGLTYTLPRLIGQQKASLLFYTGRRITGEEALAWGLADVLAEPEHLREQANELAIEIAQSAPLALLSTRATMRGGLADAVKAATDHEFKEQAWLMRTEDHREGVKAVAERRPGRFAGK